MSWTDFIYEFIFRSTIKLWVKFKGCLFMWRGQDKLCLFYFHWLFLLPTYYFFIALVYLNVIWFLSKAGILDIRILLIIGLIKIWAFIGIGNQFVGAGLFLVCFSINKVLDSRNPLICHFVVIKIEYPFLITIVFIPG